MTGIQEFKGLRNGTEILRAVKNHHFHVQKHTLDARLKEADQEVRQMELARQFSAAVAADRVAKQEELLTKHDLSEAPVTANRDPNLSHFGAYCYSKPLLVDISGWFKSEKIIDVINENVNQVIGGWWNAVSTPDGYVFCSAMGLYKLLHRAFPRQPALLAVHANVIARQDILFSVVMTLAREHNAIATELLGNREFLCPMSITSSNGKAKRESYMLVPLKAKALGLSCAQLEAEKSQTILRMVKAIVPLQQEPREKKSEQSHVENRLEQAPNVLSEQW